MEKLGMPERLKQHSKWDVAQSEVGTSNLKEDNDDNAMQCKDM